MSVLVVVPCLNEARHIRSVLEGLLADKAAALVVVADGGSTDGSRQIVEDMGSTNPRVRLLDNPGRLQSIGLNRAAEAFGAGHQWLARIDAHAGYPQAYVSGLVAAGLAQAADSVVVPMTSQGETTFQIAAAAAQNSVLGAGGAAHRSRGQSRWVDHGHHALFRLDRFKALGGYDESFSHNEDAEYDERLRAAGGRIWLADELAITYFPRRTPGALFKQYQKYGQGRARTILTRGGRMGLRQALPLAVAPALCLALLAPVWPWAALPAATWMIVSLTFGLVVGARARRVTALLSGWPAMVMHAAWSFGFWGEAVRTLARRPR